MHISHGSDLHIIVKEVSVCTGSYVTVFCLLLTHTDWIYIFTPLGYSYSLSRVANLSYGDRKIDYNKRLCNYSRKRAKRGRKNTVNCFRARSRHESTKSSEFTNHILCKDDAGQSKTRTNEGVHLGEIVDHGSIQIL